MYAHNPPVSLIKTLKPYVPTNAAPVVTDKSPPPVDVAVYCDRSPVS